MIQGGWHDDVQHSPFSLQMLFEIIIHCTHAVFSDLCDDCSWVVVQGGDTVRREEVHHSSGCAPYQRILSACAPFVRPPILQPSAHRGRLSHNPSQNGSPATLTPKPLLHHRKILSWAQFQETMMTLVISLPCKLMLMIKKHCRT